MIDEIQEEIKREDFFNRLKMIMPFLIIGVILILLGTGGYVWWQSHCEKKLVEQEQLYSEAQGYLKEGKFSQARTILDKLIQESFAFKSIALLQKARIDQTDFVVTGLEKAFKSLESQYTTIDRSYHSLPLKNFLMSALGLLNLNPKDDEFNKKITSIMTPQSHWYFFGLMRQALMTYRNGNPKEIQKTFSLWEKEAVKSYQVVPSWLIQYSTIGSVIPFQKSEP